jgi:hypothetical protein
MHPLLKDIRHNPLLWLLVFVPIVFAVHKLRAEAHTLLFILSILAIVPLAALLSHATESVAAETGGTVGGLLNATLGNLTELVIALAALRAGRQELAFGSSREEASFDQGSAHEVRHTLGLRLWGHPGPWDYNAEVVYQLGTFGAGQIQAWTAASDTG